MGCKASKGSSRSGTSGSSGYSATDPDSFSAIAVDFPEAETSKERQARREARYEQSKTKLKSFTREALSAHNRKRKIHDTPPLVLSEALNGMAQRWADYLANSNTFEYSSEKRRNGAGENIGVHEKQVDGDEITELWYKEIEKYDFENPCFKGVTANFTQMVWKESKEAGFGRSLSRSKSGVYVFVANYFPPGNQMGGFKPNVMPPEGRRGSNRTGERFTIGEQSREKTPLNIYREQALYQHNRMRRLHGAPDLDLSYELNNMAQEWAEHLAKTGNFENSPENRRREAGENLAAHTNVIGGEEVVDMWYNEIKDYDFKKPGFKDETGHFTQMVWKGTTHVGLGMSLERGKQGMYIYVANYRPHGNICGNFRENVLPLGTEPTTGVAKPLVQTWPTTQKRSTGEKFGDNFRLAVLAAHNRKRRLHSAPDLKLNDMLNRLAERWAEWMSKLEKVMQSPDDRIKGAGENVAAIPRILTGEELTDVWYDEIKSYNFYLPGYSEKTCHFTQMVWRGSKEIGVGASQLPTSKGVYMYVVNYQPKGNIEGQYENNVLAKKL